MEEQQLHELKFSGNAKQKGFALLLDASFAIILVAGFLVLMGNLQPTQLKQLTLTNQKENTETAIDALDNNILLTFDDNSFSLQQKADFLRQMLLDNNTIQQNSEIRVEIQRFSKLPNDVLCKTSQNFTNCFSLPTDANSGPGIPDGKNILKGQKVRLIKQAPGECTVSTPKANSQALFKQLTDIATKKQITALFAGDLNLEGIIVDVNAKKNGTTILQDNDIVQCNDTIDTNISFRAPGRKPADIMLVDDKSGSMSWDGQLTLSNEQDIFYDQNYVFVADGTAGLRDINVEIPNKPSIKGTYNTVGTAYGVHVSGNTAFVADGTNGLVTINVTNKASPSLLGTLNTIGNARKVFVQGNYAYVVTITAGNSSLDLTTTELSDTDLQIGHAGSPNTYAAQSFIPTATTIDAISIFARKSANQNPASDLTLRICTTIACTSVLATGTIPVGDFSRNNQWLDVNFASPANVTIGTTYFLVLTATTGSRYYLWAATTTNPYASGIAYKETTAQATTDATTKFWRKKNAGLQLIDISNPASPIYKSGVAGTDPNDIFVSGNYAYFSDGTAGLKIVDISDPTNANTIGTIDTTDALSLVATGNYAYIADGTAGLRVINITNKNSPSIAATLNTAGTAYDLKLYSDNNVYLADDTNLLVINVSTPTSPTIVKGYGTPYNYRRIDVNSDWAFLIPGYDGLVTMNIYSGPKIDQLKKADVNFVNFSDWKTTDQLGLVSFQGTVTTDQTLLTATDTNRQTLVNKINSLVSNDGTAMFDAICAANRELSSVRARSNSYKFEIAMTDGVSNSDTNSYCEINYGAAYNAKALGIKVYTIGFGPDADAATLQQIANITDANYYTATDENALQEVYDLIRRDIGATMADQNAWDKNFSFFIPLQDQNFVITPRSNIRLAGDKNYLVFDINLMTENNFTQNAFYSIKMPCQNNRSCDNNSITLPDTNSYFDNITNPYDFNKLTLIMQYRDLRIDLTSAFLRPTLDLNALVSNIGYQTMTNIAVSFYDGNAFAPNKSSPIIPNSSNPNPIASILQQASTNQQNNFSRDLNDYYLWAVIDSTTQNDCPRYNEAVLHCTQQKETQYYIINYWVWIK